MTTSGATGGPITRTVVLDARLGAVREVDRIEVRRIVMPPGCPAGLHVHNGPVVGSVVTGSVVVQVEGGPAATLGPGDVFFEPEGARIARFDAGDEGVTFLAYFPVGPGEVPEMTFPEAEEGRP